MTTEEALMDPSLWICHGKFGEYVLLAKYPGPHLPGPIGMDEATASTWEGRVEKWSAVAVLLEKKYRPLGFWRFEPDESLEPGAIVRWPPDELCEQMGGRVIGRMRVAEWTSDPDVAARKFRCFSPA